MRTGERLSPYSATALDRQQLYLIAGCEWPLNQQGCHGVVVDPVRQGRFQPFDSAAQRHAKLSTLLFSSIQLAPAWTQRLQLQSLCVTPVPATHGTALRYS